MGKERHEIEINGQGTHQTALEGSKPQASGPQYSVPLPLRHGHLSLLGVPPPLDRDLKNPR